MNIRVVRPKAKEIVQAAELIVGTSIPRLYNKSDTIDIDMDDLSLYLFGQGFKVENAQRISRHVERFFKSKLEVK